MLSNPAKEWTWPFTFILGFLYSYFINTSEVLGDSLATIFFLIGLLFYMFFKVRQTHNSDLANPRAAILRICAELTVLLLGVVSGMLITSAPDNVSWMIDSYNLHLPMATNVLETLQGKINHIPVSRQGLSTHLWVGFLFFIFGKSIYVSILGLHVIKLISTIVIYQTAKDLWDKKCGIYAALVYSLSPMVFFYSFTFYKESFVQLYMALLTLFLVKTIHLKKKIYLIPFAVVLFVLYFERFYLCLLFIPPLLLVGPRITQNRFLKRSLAPLILAIAAVIAWNNGVGLRDGLTYLEELRITYSQFPDVNYNYNYNISYPLAFIKTLLTPFFSLKKFTLFYDYSYILIWGSFIHQATVLAATYSLLINLKNDLRTHLILSTPFIFFLAICAYVAPWSGRLRDSFYPLIAIYAGYFIFKLCQGEGLKGLLNKKNS